MEVLHRDLGTPGRIMGLRNKGQAWLFKIDFNGNGNSAWHLKRACCASMMAGVQTYRTQINIWWVWQPIYNSSPSRQKTGDSKSKLVHDVRLIGQFWVSLRDPALRNKMEDCAFEYQPWVSRYMEKGTTMSWKASIALLCWDIKSLCLKWPCFLFPQRCCEDSRVSLQLGTLLYQEKQ